MSNNFRSLSAFALLGTAISFAVPTLTASSVFAEDCTPTVSAIISPDGTTATFTDSSSCPSPIGFASFDVPGKTIWPIETQTYHDGQNGDISGNSTKTLGPITHANCFAQIDAKSSHITPGAPPVAGAIAGLLLNQDKPCGEKTSPTPSSSPSPTPPSTPSPSSTPVATPVLTPVVVETPVAPVTIVIPASNSTTPDYVPTDHRVALCHYEVSTGNFEKRLVQPDQVQKDLSHGDTLLATGKVCINPTPNPVQKKSPVTQSNSIVLTIPEASTAPTPIVEVQAVVEQQSQPVVTEKPTEKVVDTQSQPEEVEILTPPVAGDGNNAEEIVP